MADQVTLPADARAERGRRNANRLRHDGRTPGVLYGHGVSPTAVAVDARELYHALHTDAGLNVLIRLQVEGEEHLTIAREVQRHPVRDDILHVDFLAVSQDQLLDYEVPIHLLGDTDVSRETGGVVNQVLHTLPIKARPLNVPNFLELSVEGMHIGDVKRAAEVDLPEGSELNIDPDRTIVTINAPTILEEPTEVVDDEFAGEGEDEDAAAEGEGADAAADEGGE